MEMNAFSVEQDLVHKISSEIAWQYRIFPVNWSDKEFQFAIDEKSTLEETRLELMVLLGKNIELLPMSSELILKLISKYYYKSKSTSVTTISSNSNPDDLVEIIINEANKLKSSDIHIEIYENECRIRFRIDGKLIERYKLNPDEFPSLTNKIKIRAHLDISERRLPQDGRINYIVEDMKFDIRVSTLPTLYGEKIVLRLLGNDASNLSIDELGFSSIDLKKYKESIQRTNGIILISGPTGSGKTTTLYATLKQLNKDSKNILTIEDPIEYTLKGINQVQLKESIGLNFATSLRTFLRQDPDVIMVGEIRDADTANMAIRASLTGHLVLSTIHTNSAWGTITRLIDMGIASYLLSNTIAMSVAQRLVRLLCNDCKISSSVSQSHFPINYKIPDEVDKQYIPIGCDNCFYTGYKGRIAIYEVIPIDYEFIEKIRHQDQEVSKLLDEKGIQTLSNQAFSMFLKGETSLEEIYPLLIQ